MHPLSEFFSEEHVKKLQSFNIRFVEQIFDRLETPQGLAQLSQCLNYPIEELLKIRDAIKAKYPQLKVSTPEQHGLGFRIDPIQDQLSKEQSVDTEKVRFNLAFAVEDTEIFKYHIASVNPNITIHDYISKYALCSCSQATFESVFNSKLEWKTKTIRNLNRGLQQVSDWVIVKEPEIPESLRGIVQKVELNKKTFLTD